MTKIEDLTLDQLHKAISIRQRIDKLQTELARLTGSATGSAGGRRTYRMSRAGRAAISRAAKARWSKWRGGKPKKAAGKRRKMSAAGRARIAAAARRRWAKAKAAGRNRL